MVGFNNGTLRPHIRRRQQSDGCFSHSNTVRMRWLDISQDTKDSELEVHFKRVTVAFGVQHPIVREPLVEIRPFPSVSPQLFAHVLPIFIDKFARRFSEMTTRRLPIERLIPNRKMKLIERFKNATHSDETSLFHLSQQRESRPCRKIKTATVKGLIPVM